MSRPLMHGRFEHDRGGTSRSSARHAALPGRRLLVVVVVAVANVAVAQAFEGRVVDGQGRPVAGAEITILGRAGESRTDSDGRFVWTPDPPTPFEVLVVAPGGIFMKPILVERLPAGSPLQLTVEPLVNERVTVLGSAGSIEAAPAAATATLAAAEIQTRTPANLIQVLENVAGVSQVSEGHAAVPAIRGLARGRTLILVDGARVTAERRAGPSATYLDPDMIEGVEVARGPGSVAYGSDALGGVISVRTRSVAPGSGFAVRFSGTLGAGIPDRRASGELSHGFARGGVLLGLHTRDVNDYRGPRGPVINSGYSDHGVLARANHQVGPGLLVAAWQSNYGRDIERPRDNSALVRFSYPREDSHRVTSSYELLGAGGFSRVLVTGFVGSYAQRTDQERVATAARGRSIERADVAARDFHVRSLAERRIGNARVELGLDVNGRFGLRALDIAEAYGLDGPRVSYRENLSIDRARRTDTGVYGSIDAAIAPALTWAAGLRGDYVTTRNRGGFFGDRHTAHSAVSGFTALTAGSFRGMSFTGQVARGFRDPVLSDRYYRGPSGRGFITGNPDLAPETSLQVDASVRYTSSRVRAAAYAYHYRIHDLIERYETDPDFFFFRNRGRARLRGVEVEAQGQLGRGVSLEMAFHTARGVAMDDDAHLDDIAAPTVSAQVRKAFDGRGFAQLRTAWSAEDTRPGPTERQAPQYTLVDAAAGVTVASGVEIRLMVRNLSNADYLASEDVRAVAAPGRSASVTVTVRRGAR